MTDGTTATAIAVLAVMLTIVVVAVAGACAVFATLLFQRILRPSPVRRPLPPPARSGSAAARAAIGARGGGGGGAAPVPAPPEADSGRRGALDGWRYEQLVELGVEPLAALEGARAGFDVAAVRGLVARGCPPALALDILRPDDPSDDP